MKSETVTIERERNLHYLEYLCELGWKEREIPTRAEALGGRRGVPKSKILKVYTKRLRHEIKEIDRRGVIDYFLIIRDLVAEAKRRGILVGPGRGSAAGSLILYLLGVTDVDPIRHDLLFERFLAPGRIDLPDVDLDFEDRRRDELIGYLSERYGRDRVARVGTVNKMGARLLVRDLGRVMLISLDEVNKVSEAIDPKVPLAMSADASEHVQAFLDKYPDVLEYAEVIEGHVRNLGVHAAGVVVSPVPLSRITPIEARDGEAVTAFDMWGVQDCGLLKLDLLGLRTLSIVKDAIEVAHAMTGDKIDLTKIDLDDRPTLDAFTAGDMIGVFQFDSPSAIALCRGVEFTDFDVIVAMTSLDRPGTARSGLAQAYLERNADPEKIESLHPVYDSITADTLGVPVFQEHVIKLCRELGGFTPEEADKVRKLIGKSKGADALREYAGKFIDGATMGAGMRGDRAEGLWDQLCEFGGYSFNKSHATAYSVIAYWTQWLKVHYPEAFFLAVMKNEPKQEKILAYVKELERRGIGFEPPNVQNAGGVYRVVDGKIVPSLEDIKFVSKKAVDEIQEGQPFKNLIDFIERCPSANKRVVSTLIQARAMEAIIPNARETLARFDKLWRLKASEEGKIKILKFLEASKAKDDFDNDEFNDVASEVNPFVIRTHPLERSAELVERVVKVKTVEPERVEKTDDGFFIGALKECKINESINSKGETRIYGSLSIDGGDIKPNRFKMDEEALNACNPEAMEGDLVIGHYHRGWKAPVLQFLVSVSDLDNKLREGADLDYWELIIRKELPRGLRIYAGARTINDKNGNEMAFVTVQGPGKAADGVCFSSSWIDVKDERIRYGDPVKLKIKKEMRDGKRSVIFQRIRKA